MSDNTFKLKSLINVNIFSYSYSNSLREVSGKGSIEINSQYFYNNILKYFSYSDLFQRQSQPSSWVLNFQQQVLLFQSKNVSYFHFFRIMKY